MIHPTLDRRSFLTGTFTLGAAVVAGAAIGGCSSSSASDLALDDTQKDATQFTTDANNAVYTLLDFDDEQEREFATRGLIAAPDELEITTEDGTVAWSQKAYSFLDTDSGDPADAPATANPSLWRNTQLNHLYGLFEVTDGIYQVRGYDMTNITFVRGKKGWIVFDPLMSAECSQAAYELVSENLGERPISGIIISHPHIDHYGGIKGIVSEEQVKKKSIPIIVPEGFEEHAVAENVYAGTAMGRRASYQYGNFIDRGEKGSLSIGIGMGQSHGTTGYISPTDIITKTGETRTIDGVKMEFQMTPGTEAPAEMNTWFPQFNALWIAENCTGTLHNLYTLRGAEVRDGNAWASYLMEAKTRYGAKVKMTFQAHNWPHFGNDVVNKYIESTAAVYKFINDQTLMYLNQGYTSAEIARKIELPDDLARVWYTRQYYGTVAHNARAVYQKYMGFYDANPVNLFPQTPEDEAKKLVEYLGDTDAVLEHAKEDYDAGEYQWVAKITNTLVFADPENTQARLLCADALEQLGYQAESGPWRNVYLSGAYELRHGVLEDMSTRLSQSTDLMKSMSVELMIDYLGILTDSIAAQGTNLKVNLNFTDEKPWLLTVRSGVVLGQEGVQADDADATLTLAHLAFFGILSKDDDTIATIKVKGDSGVIDQLTEHIVDFDKFFNIIEP